MLDQTIGFVGAGQMATALARGFVAAGLTEGRRIVAHDPVDSAAANFAVQVQDARVVSDNQTVVSTADVVFLAVKPQAMKGALASIQGESLGDKLFVSIAAGVTLARLTQELSAPRIIRVMPNTPALVGCGASAYSASAGATEADRDLVAQLLGAIGVAVAVDESLLDAVTGLSGSGPAFVYVLIEALSDGGVRMGLPRSVATTLAAQTVCGAAKMVLETGEHPGVLKDRVASPGGTTIAGLQALEDRGARGALIAAVEAATRRSQELGR